jgi:ring-1,2-phenylacetyl-CoA epoxidase subunit PaaC
MTRDEQLFQYLLRLGDSPLILAQRLGERVGHGPVLEEDIAQANVGLDLLGQARMWLSYAGRGRGRVCARRRDEDSSRSCAILPGFATSFSSSSRTGVTPIPTARQFLFDAWHVLLLRALAQSSDARIAGIAAKAVKEADYHVERSGDWVIRLGDGTEESHARMQASIDALWMYTGEMFVPDATELELVAAGVAADVARSPSRGGATSTRFSPKRRCRHRAMRSCSRAASAASTPSTLDICSPRCRCCNARIRERSGERATPSRASSGERARCERARGRRWTMHGSRSPASPTRKSPSSR